MENASKALIMAGSILMAILVVSLLIFGYNQLSNLEQTRENSKEVDKMAEYMKNFEQFSRVVYGSELLSLANLQQDYHYSEAREDVGYDDVEISVTIKKEISGSIFLKAGTYSIQEIAKAQKEIEKEIEQYETPNSHYNNRSVKYYAQKSYREIAMDFGYTEIPGNILDYDIIDYVEDNKSDGKYTYFKQCIEDMQKYVDIKSIYNEFRTGKQFKCIETTYNDLNGRLNGMKFEEVV